MQNLILHVDPDRFPTAQRRHRQARNDFSVQIFPLFLQLSENSDKISGVERC